MKPDIETIIRNMGDTFKQNEILGLAAAVNDTNDGIVLATNAAPEGVGLILGLAFGGMKNKLDGDDLKEFMQGYLLGVAEGVKNDEKDLRTH